MARLARCVGRLLGALLVALAPAARAEATALNADELRRLAQVLAAVRANHVEPVDDRTLVEGAIRGLFAGLDAQSAFIDAAEFKELQLGDRSAGIGLQLRSVDGFHEVVAAFGESPAARAALRSGDVLLAIDGWPTFGKSSTEVTRRLRGPAGSEVVLTIRRPPAEHTSAIKLQRQVVAPAPVRVEFLNQDYAWLRIPSLRADSAPTAAARLGELYARHPPAGLVLDLRDNTGGLFNAAVGIAAIFLPRGTPVAVFESRADGTRTLSAAPADYAPTGRDFLADLPADVKTVPLVVLVNGQTAAGAELIAGALQDHRRARLIGTPTFGLAAIQSVLPLPRGTAIKLTTARWRTPAGRSLAGSGLHPDRAATAAERAPERGAAGTAAADPLLDLALQALAESRSEARQRD